MLTLVRRGAGLYHHQGNVVRVSRGFVGLVLPSADPGLLIADTRDPYEHYYCRFAGHEALRMAEGAVAVWGGQSFFAYPPWPKAASILEAMLALDRLASAPRADWMTQAEAELARLLSLLVTPSGLDESKLSAAALRSYLTDHVSEAFDLENMAQYFGVSRFHLSRSASRLLGESLGSASRGLKLDFSRSLLATPSLELSIADIALRVGYVDALYFSRLFRRHVGVSPSEYRTRIAARAGPSEWSAGAPDRARDVQR